MSKSTVFTVSATLVKAAKEAAASERGANLKRQALSAAFITEGYDTPEAFRAPKKGEPRERYDALLALSAVVHFGRRTKALKEWNEWVAADTATRKILKEAGQKPEEADRSGVTRNLSNWRQQIERYLAAQETEGEGSAPKKRVVKTVAEQWLAAMATIEKQGIAARQSDDDKRGMSKERLNTAMEMAANLAAFIKGEEKPKPKATARRKAATKK